MNEIKFKALMYNGFYVNHAMLTEGIYSTDLPYLFRKETTLESLSKIKIGFFSLPDSYYKNLKMCELVDVTIQINT